MRLPTWLLELPIGEYTLTKLSILVNRDKGNITRVLKRIGVKKRVGEQVYRNLHEVIYLWEGVDKKM